jgi:peptidylprolyl isomerase
LASFAAGWVQTLPKLIAAIRDRCPFFQALDGLSTKAPRPTEDLTVKYDHQFWLAMAAALTLTIAGCGKKDEGHGKSDKAANAGSHGDKKANSNKPEKADKSAGNDDEKAEDAEKPAEKPKPVVEKISSRERRKPPANVAKAPADALKTSKGIPYKLLKKGTGTTKPQRDDTVWVRYTAWETTGKVTSSTWKVKKQDPREISYRKAIPGWSNALKEMVVGERRLLWIPAKLAHANSRNRKKGPRTVDIEFVKLKVAPKAPANVKRAPKDATKTKTGLYYKRLTAGTGKVKPLAGSTVQVTYAGWTRKGICFDHTGEGDTATFNLTSVISGWTEGLQLMVEGETARFWIPEKIAYDGMDGKPRGMLVFDVKLLKIKK